MCLVISDTELSLSRFSVLKMDGVFIYLIIKIVLNIPAFNNPLFIDVMAKAHAYMKSPLSPKLLLDNIIAGLYWFIKSCT